MTRNPSRCPTSGRPTEVGSWPLRQREASTKDPPTNDLYLRGATTKRHSVAVIAADERTNMDPLVAIQPLKRTRLCQAPFQKSALLAGRILPLRDFLQDKDALPFCRAQPLGESNVDLQLKCFESRSIPSLHPLQMRLFGVRRKAALVRRHAVLRSRVCSTQDNRLEWISAIWQLLSILTSCHVKLEEWCPRTGW